MPVSTEKYRSTDISGDYAAMARAFGGYGERVEKPARHRAGHQARHRGDPEGPAGAARVHHLQGGRGLQAVRGKWVEVEPALPDVAWQPIISGSI